MSEIQEKITLRELLHRHALTQRELARRADLSEGAVSDLIRNERSSHPRTLLKVASLLTRVVGREITIVELVEMSERTSKERNDA